MNLKSKEYDQVSILLVEDDDVDAMGVQRAMKKLRILNPLIRARNGLEGLELLRGITSENNPDGLRVARPYIILLDIKMPCMNGLEMLKALREDEKLSDSVVFIFTTSEDDEDKLAAYKHQIAGYIQKKQIENGFIDVLNMLDTYWRVVELPR